MNQLKTPEPVVRDAEKSLLIKAVRKNIAECESVGNRQRGKSPCNLYAVHQADESSLRLRTDPEKGIFDLFTVIAEVDVDRSIVAYIVVTGQKYDRRTVMLNTVFHGNIWKWQA